MFVTLSTDKTTKIRVNVNHIVSYGPNSNMYDGYPTKVKLVNGSEVLVLERPTDIDSFFAPPAKKEDVPDKKIVEEHDDDGFNYGYGHY